jgi:hypothetical protein
MHIVDSIVHNCGGDVLSSEAKSPCLLDIEIETSFASSLTCVFQIPLVLVERIGRRLDGREVKLALETISQGSVSSLGSSVSGKLLYVKNVVVVVELGMMSD